MDFSLHLTNISLSLDETAVLKDISLDIPEGKTTIFMGPSGCGKSTLLKIASGLIIPDEGDIFLGDKELNEMTPYEMKQFRKSNGFVFQDAALWANKSIYQNLELPLRYHFPDITTKKINEKINYLCEEIGFHDELYMRPAQISAGEQKMISFVRALITDPSIIFMDEPTASVDPSTTQRMLKMIARQKQEGKTIIWVTHEPQIATTYGDTIVLLKNGCLVASGTRYELMEMDIPEVKHILHFA